VPEAVEPAAKQRSSFGVMGWVRVQEKSPSLRPSALCAREPGSMPRHEPKGRSRQYTFFPPTRIVVEEVTCLTRARRPYQFTARLPHTTYRPSGGFTAVPNGYGTTPGACGREPVLLLLGLPRIRYNVPMCELLLLDHGVYPKRYLSGAVADRRRETPACRFGPARRKHPAGGGL